VWLVLFGVTCAWAWAWGAGTRALDWTTPWWLETPAVFGFYGIVYWLYDRFLWKRVPFRLIHSVPNLNGHYRVAFHTSYDNHALTHEGNAIIEQSWSQMLIRMDTNSSSSESCAAWLYLSLNKEFSLKYLYRNEPKPSAKPSMNIHVGTAEVFFDMNREGRGSYYSGRGRLNYGDLTIKPVEIHAFIAKNKKEAGGSDET
jgi:hypothetical protein